MKHIVSPPKHEARQGCD